jgi:hypothetical protein
MKMNDTVLYDKLLHLRLPAFREGLREQQANPKFAELCFEERLALLVEQECIRRHNSCLYRSLRTAAFPIQAALQDLEFPPESGLDRHPGPCIMSVAFGPIHVNPVSDY